MESTSTRPQELDIAFCCDCTGSMGSYIKSAQDNIRKISQAIHEKAQNVSVRYALVKYRDHPPQDTTFITEVYPFTKKIDTMKANVDTMAAQGGGDGPEAVSAGLHEVLQLDWRANSVKICVFIADAPPHGLGENGDGFPDGCPLGTDPIQTCKQLATLGVTVYAVGVEPILSTSYKYARDFMMMVAAVTEGKFLPLGKAEILTDVIVNGALEGVNMAEAWATLEKEVADEAEKNGDQITEEEKVARVEQQLATKNIATAQVEVANPYMDSRYNNHNMNVYCNATSLKSAKANVDPTINSYVQMEVADFSWAKQEATGGVAAMSSAQQCRATNRAKKMKGLFEY